MLEWAASSAVERHPEKLSGAWVFRGTCVPVSALFTNLESGAAIEDFVNWFPGVSREQVISVVGHANRSLVVPANP